MRERETKRLSERVRERELDWVETQEIKLVLDLHNLPQLQRHIRLVTFEAASIDCQWSAASTHPPYVATHSPALSLCLPCHKSIRVKFFGQSIKSITKSAIFFVEPRRHAVMSLSCWTKAVASSPGCQRQLPVVSSVRVAYTPRGTHAKDIVGKWINGKLKAIFCLPSRWEYVCVCVFGLSSWFNCACVCGFCLVRLRFKLPPSLPFDCSSPSVVRNACKI